MRYNPGNGSYGVGFLIIDLADLVVTNEIVSVSDVSVETGVCGIELLPVDDLLIVGVVLLIEDLIEDFPTFPKPFPIKQTSFGWISSLDHSKTSGTQLPHVFLIMSLRIFQLKSLGSSLK